VIFRIAGREAAPDLAAQGKAADLIIASACPELAIVARLRAAEKAAGGAIARPLPGSASQTRPSSRRSPNRRSALIAPHRRRNRRGLAARKTSPGHVQLIDSPATFFTAYVQNVH
jgi:hypothetical protein